MPSFGYGEAPGLPHSRSPLVSLSQHSGCGEPSPASTSRPSVRCSATRAVSLPRMLGTYSRPVSPHAQVLRNHSVGSTCRVAGSGPRFSATIRMHMSVGVALA
jgi:hypothetical protein